MKRVALLLLALPAFAAACSHAGVEDHAWEWTNQLPEGATVHIRDGAGNITVHQAPASSGRLVTMTASRAWRRGHARDIDFAVVQHGNDFYVCAMWRGSGKCGENGYRGRRGGGILEALALFKRPSDATASFVAELPANVAVDARTNIGSVDVDGLSSSVVAKATNGTVTASHVSGPLTLTTVNGNVRASVDAFAAADSIHLTTTNGVIRAELPAGIEGRFDLSVVNGVVNTDLPLNGREADRRGRHVMGQIGASTRIVRAHTNNGTVSVTTKAASTSH